MTERVCTTCGLRKHVMGEDVAAAMGADVCGYGCPGYLLVPRPAVAKGASSEAFQAELEVAGYADRVDAKESGGCIHCNWTGVLGPKLVPCACSVEAELSPEAKRLAEVLVGDESKRCPYVDREAARIVPGLKMDWQCTLEPGHKGRHLIGGGKGQ